MELLKGGFFEDNRGCVSFSNTLYLNFTKRMYDIENADIEIYRAWQGHKI